MPVHKWRRRPSKHFGEVWVPFAHVEIQRTDGRFQAFALHVDSGAVVSLLRRSVAELLGVELEAGRQIDVTGVGGARNVAYVHELPTRFADNIAYPVPFAIAVTETVPNLLGRLQVFDRLQVEFDGTVQETRIAAPWLNPGEKRIWDFLLATERHILARWSEMDLSAPARDVARRFIERAAQVLASAVGLKKLDRCYAAPAIIRALFELAMQFEYLMDDPVPRAQRYLDFTHVTRHKQSSAIASNPSGPISTLIAQSHLREEGEKRNKAEYERVRNQFMMTTKKGRAKPCDNWYCMSIYDLADKVGWLGEYRVIYAECSAWAHGDPFSTQQIASHPFADPNAVFTLCSQYYARMLLKIADVGKVVLTSEQHGFLTAFTTQFT